jgi:sensor domain CHASE-containing protein
MHKTSSADRRWRLSLSLIVPVGLAMLAVLGCVGGFVVWSAVNNDARTVQHDRHLISHKLAQDLVNMATNQQGVTIGAKSYAVTVGNLDHGWLDRQLGWELFRDFGYEQTYVVDGSDNPIHAMQDGKEIKPARLAGGGKEFAPLRTFAPAFRNHRLST